MTISAKIIADSISNDGKRITTMQLCYQRFIHSEFMTHRAFSKNASSSRAIPVAKMIDQVRNNPAMPIHWGANQPGMQANGQIDNIPHAKTLWKIAANKAADLAECMMEIGLHKQVVNRILEPFQWIHVVVTATEWENFYTLRNHPAAQPEIQELAIQMRKAMDESIPNILAPGMWHLPYVTNDDYTSIAQYNRANGMDDQAAWDMDNLIYIARKVSAARCARVSYMKHDGSTASIEEDIELYSQLIVRPYTDKRGFAYDESDPIHASPTEHQAWPDQLLTTASGAPWWANGHMHGNLVGWVQNRKIIELGDC